MSVSRPGSGKFQYGKLKHFEGRGKNRLNSYTASAAGHAGSVLGVQVQMARAAGFAVDVALGIVHAQLLPHCCRAYPGPPRTRPITCFSDSGPSPVIERTSANRHPLRVTVALQRRPSNLDEIHRQALSTKIGRWPTAEVTGRTAAEAAHLVDKVSGILSGWRQPVVSGLNISLVARAPDSRTSASKAYNPRKEIGRSSSGRNQVDREAPKQVHLVLMFHHPASARFRSPNGPTEGPYGCNLPPP